jgi:hypothetical protein
MKLPPAVIVHGLKDARDALALGRPVTLLSAPGAVLFAGCLWWRGVIAAACVADAIDVLDCADASGLALGALRSGVNRLVLWRDAPGWPDVAAIAAQQGGFVLAVAPQALDMAHRAARHRLHAWLQATPGDIDPCLGYERRTDDQD